MWPFSIVSEQKAAGVYLVALANAFGQNKDFLL